LLFLKIENNKNNEETKEKEILLSVYFIHSHVNNGIQQEKKIEDDNSKKFSVARLKLEYLTSQILSVMSMRKINKYRHTHTRFDIRPLLFTQIAH